MDMTEKGSIASKLTFLGRGSAFNSSFGNTSAYIKDGDTLFLIDCGSLVFSKLKELNILENVSHVYVLITHTHDDHVGSLGALILYGYYSMGEMFKPSVTVVSPKETGVINVLSLVGVDETCYNFINLNRETQKSISKGAFSIKVTPHITSHVPALNCYGYTLITNNKLIYYSGDTNEINDMDLEFINKGIYGEVYIDTCKADFEGNVHLSLRKLDELIVDESNVRNKIYCMHLDTDFTKEANDLGFNVVEIG